MKKMLIVCSMITGMFLFAACPAFTKTAWNANLSAPKTEQAFNPPVENIDQHFEDGFAYVTSTIGYYGDAYEVDEERTATCPKGYRLLSCNGGISCDEVHRCEYYGELWDTGEMSCSASAHLHSTSWELSAQAVCEPYQNIKHFSTSRFTDPDQQPAAASDCNVLSPALNKTGHLY